MYIINYVKQQCVCMCMCVCVCVCMCGWVWACGCGCVGCVHICMWVSMFTVIHACVCTYVCTRVCILFIAYCCGCVQASYMLYVYNWLIGNTSSGDMQACTMCVHMYMFSYSSVAPEVAPLVNTGS